MLSNVCTVSVVPRFSNEIRRVLLQDDEVKALFLTQKEIINQYDALSKTFVYVMEKKDEILDLAQARTFDSITYSGCGSSFTLCQSAKTSTEIRLGIKANALAAGDLLINYDHYANLLKNTFLVLPSRSGGTSEVLLVAQRAKEEGIPILGICAKENSKLAEIADLCLEIPWAFDESVCQTRTVTNLYAVHLLIIGLLAEDPSLHQEIGKAIDLGEKFMHQNTPLLKKIGYTDFEDVVVLADSELAGIAKEASLAFNEIPQVPSSHHHVLDVRHGPMVLINSQTLVILVCSPADVQYQRNLVKDLRAKGARVLVVSANDADYGAEWSIRLPGYRNFAVLGIPFIFVPQMIALYKALARGINPDQPDGLTPFIELDTTRE